MPPDFTFMLVGLPIILIAVTVCLTTLALSVAGVAVFIVAKVWRKRNGQT